MDMSIKSEEVSFEKDNLKETLEKMDANVSYDVQTLIYYPYLFYEFLVENGSFINRTGQRAGCTIDGMNQLGALIDRIPQFIDAKIKRKYIMEKNINNKTALHAAERFIVESISSRMKVLKMPQLELVKQEEFYRPYWVVKGQKSAGSHFYITVDAVTGKYHPL